MTDYNRFFSQRALVMVCAAIGLALVVAACSGDAITEPEATSSPADAPTTQVEVAELVDVLNAHRETIIHQLQSFSSESTLFAQGVVQPGAALCADTECVERCVETPGCDPRIILESNGLFDELEIDAGWQSNRLVRDGAVPGEIAEALLDPDAYVFRVGPNGETVELVNEPFAQYTDDAYASLEQTAPAWMPELQDQIQSIDGYEGTVLVGAEIVAGTPRTIDGAGDLSLMPDPLDWDHPCNQPNPPRICWLMHTVEQSLFSQGIAAGVLDVTVVDQGALSESELDQVVSGEGVSFGYTGVGWCGTPPSGGWGFPEVLPQ